MVPSRRRAVERTAIAAFGGSRRVVPGRVSFGGRATAAEIRPVTPEDFPPPTVMS
jgi:hypothetical protein